MQADPIDLPRLALDLIQTVVPAHLDDDTSCMALFGARVYEELSTQRVYKQMALLLHPDKRPVDSPDIDEYSRAFLTLGSLYERVTAMALAARDALNQLLGAIQQRLHFSMDSGGHVDYLHSQQRHHRPLGHLKHPRCLKPS